MKNLPRPEGFEFDENLIKNDVNNGSCHAI